VRRDEPTYLWAQRARHEPSLAQLRLLKRHTQSGFGARLRIEGYHDRLGLSDMAGMPALGNHDERTVHPWRDL
jgi:hypothetical protein